jgi:hypothetical protein
VLELRRSIFLVLETKRKGYHILFQYGKVLLMPRQSIFILSLVLKVRDGNLYRLRGQPMSFVANRRREINEEDQLNP